MNDSTWNLYALHAHLAAHDEPTPNRFIRAFRRNHRHFK